MRRAAFLAGLVALAGCAGSERSSAAFSGTYSAGFETLAFWPDREDATWRRERGPVGPYWVEGERSAMRQLNAAMQKYNGGSPWGSIRVRVIGRLSAPGAHGHLGAYSYVLHIERIEAVGPIYDSAGVRG